MLFQRPYNFNLLKSIATHVPRRFLSEHSPAQIGASRAWLEKLNGKTIPQHEFVVTFSRASGAGGQKVNKTSSKATIALSPEKWVNGSCYWIPLPVKEQLQETKIRYETKQGGILIQSDRSRNREDNTQDCFNKLVTQIKEVVRFAGETSEENLQKWEELADIRKERLKEDKKKNSDKKKSRQKKFDW